MKDLNLRLRVFLLFGALVLGSYVGIIAGMWIGFRQLADPAAISAFVTSALISCFGVAGIGVLVWLLFDENVSKPITSLAANLRVRAHADVETTIDPTAGRYLGDLADAVSAFQSKVDDASKSASKVIAQKTDQLRQQRKQLLEILSDIPTAVIIANADHQIILYDGQAAELMEVEAPARLGGSVFDYLQKGSVERAFKRVLAQDDRRKEVALNGHSGAIYSGHIRVFDDLASYTLMLKPLSPDAERPLVFDFGLMDKGQPSDLDDTALRDLTFVVFDSETTGLDPDKDEVVQLGAVRVVNGKLVPGEVFDTLINPGVPIPASSTRVHRIDDVMVAHAPPFSIGCRDFHSFADGAVIIAHNAPFDMAFMHREAKEIGVDFDHPVLDTVHLSAIVFGGSDEHTLDALCERLRVHIPDDMRHTAIGDAVATAQVLVAMLPILEGRGITTFGSLRAEVKKHRRILAVQT